MPGLSDYAEAACLNALLRGITLVAAPVNSLRLALFTTDPTDAGTGAEVAGAWYTRMATGAFTAPAPIGSSQGSTNINSVTFGAVTGAAVTVTHAGIIDAANGGNLLFSNQMPSPKTLQVGDVLSFAPGSLVASLD